MEARVVLQDRGLRTILKQVMSTSFFFFLIDM